MYLEYLFYARHFAVDIIIPDLLLLLCYYYYGFYSHCNKSRNQRNLKACTWWSWNFHPQTLNQISEFKTGLLVWGWTNLSQEFTHAHLPLHSCLVNNYSFSEFNSEDSSGKPCSAFQTNLDSHVAHFHYILKLPFKMFYTNTVNEFTKSFYYWVGQTVCSGFLVIPYFR